MPQATTVIELIKALLSNAHDLLDDAQLLHDSGRYARALALATMAAEEHGKFAFCLDQLLGNPPRTERKFIQAWTEHREKLENLVVFRAAFVDELPMPPGEELMAQPAAFHKQRMSALYVDLSGDTVKVPVSDKALSERMILDVRASVTWVEPLFSQLSPEMVPLLATVASSIERTLAKHLEGLPIDGALAQLRAIVADLPGLTGEQIAESLQSNEYTALLGLQHIGASNELIEDASARRRQEVASEA